MHACVVGSASLLREEVWAARSWRLGLRHAHTGSTPIKSAECNAPPLRAGPAYTSSMQRCLAVFTCKTRLAARGHAGAMTGGTCRPPPCRAAWQSAASTAAGRTSTSSCHPPKPTSLPSIRQAPQHIALWVKCAVA